MKDHYLHELGFLASFSQLTGATIFSIAGFTALARNQQPPFARSPGWYLLGTTSRRRHRLHHQWNTLSSRNTEELVYTIPRGSRLAYRPLEPSRRHRLHALRRARAWPTTRVPAHEYQASLSTFWGSFVSPSSSIHRVSALTNHDVGFLDWQCPSIVRVIAEASCRSPSFLIPVSAPRLKTLHPRPLSDRCWRPTAFTFRGIALPTLNRYADSTVPGGKATAKHQKPGRNAFPFVPSPTREPQAGRRHADQVLIQLYDIVQAWQASAMARLENMEESERVGGSGVLNQSISPPWHHRIIRQFRNT